VNNTCETRDDDSPWMRVLAVTTPTHPACPSVSSTIAQVGDESHVGVPKLQSNGRDFRVGETNLPAPLENLEHLKISQCNGKIHHKKFLGSTFPIGLNLGKKETNICNVYDVSNLCMTSFNIFPFLLPYSKQNRCNIFFMNCYEDDKLWSLDLKYENNDKIVFITFCICFPK